MNLWNYIQGREGTLAFLTYQHASLAFQTVLAGTVVGVLLATAVYRLPLVSALSLTSSRVALTIPSLALLALLLVPFGLGVVPSFIMLAFFAALPVIGNAIVGLRSGLHVHPFGEPQRSFSGFAGMRERVGAGEPKLGRAPRAAGRVGAGASTRQLRMDIFPERRTARQREPNRSELVQLQADGQSRTGGSR